MPKSQYVFQFLSGKYEGGCYHFPTQLEFSLGRDAEADLVLVEDMVSRFHAKITVVDRLPFIEDTNSSNGTYVNGQKIIEKTKLHPGDKLLIGKSILRFSIDEHHPQLAETQASREANYFDAIPPSGVTRAFSIDYLEHIVERNKKTNVPLPALERLKLLFPKTNLNLMIKHPLETDLNSLSARELKWLQEIWNANGLDDFFEHTHATQEDAALAVLNLWDKGLLMPAS